MSARSVKMLKTPMLSQKDDLRKVSCAATALA
jgi:hypothetical protein